MAGDELRGLQKYLADESRRSGCAEAVAWPTDTAQLCELMRLAAARRWPVTVSGARTGIAGGAVPEGGLVVSLERMNRVLALCMGEGEGEELRLRLQAGVLLCELRKAIASGQFADAASWDEPSRQMLAELRRQPRCFPPDPTETSATLGGMIACNASGAHTFRYGPTRAYVTALTVVLVDGGLLELRRGQCRADPEGWLTLRWPSGEERRFRVPTYGLPHTKNVAGYAAGPGLDAVDLFIGSEGTLGVIAEAEIRLLPAPERQAAEVVFWPREAQALAFVQALRRERQELGLEAVEYFDHRSLEFLRERRTALGASSGVPECLPDGGCAVYLDLGLPAAALPASLERLAALIVDLGGDLARTWSLHERGERETLRRFRHALPEAVNARIAEIRRHYPELTKLGTDMAVPDDCLEPIMATYHAELQAAGLEYVIFGHIGDNHLHVNILPRTPAEYARGKELYLKFAEQVVAMGGSPAAEHGIGKLKRPFLRLLVGEAGLAEMAAVKHAFDPELRLGPGNLFASEAGP